MGRKAALEQPDFVISTGDNFYESTRRLPFPHSSLCARSYIVNTNAGAPHMPSGYVASLHRSSNQVLLISVGCHCVSQVSSNRRLAAKQPDCSLQHGPDKMLLIGPSDAALRVTCGFPDRTPRPTYGHDLLLLAQRGRACAQAA